jgi:hypothetical protein
MHNRIRGFAFATPARHDDRRPFVTWTCRRSCSSADGWSCCGTCCAATGEPWKRSGFTALFSAVGGGHVARRFAFSWTQVPKSPQCKASNCVAIAFREIANVTKPFSRCSMVIKRRGNSVPDCWDGAANENDTQSISATLTSTARECRPAHPRLAQRRWSAFQGRLLQSQGWFGLHLARQRGWRVRADNGPRVSSEIFRDRAAFG